MGYIPRKSLENLKNYSYKGVDRSLLSRFVLGPYWTWLVTLWPFSVAPNVITLTGLAIVFFNFLTLLYYDPFYLTEKEYGIPSPPQWVYFTWAIGLFAYQSLDAIDGKQARRTGMSGPLGEMFDHGCDALNTTLEVILACRALGLGRSWWTISSQIATTANFYLTTWEEYHTGQLFLGAFSGPVEGIIMIIVIYIVTGIYGSGFWEQRIWTFTHLEHSPLFNQLPNLPLNISFMVFGGIALGFNIYNSYMNVRTSTIAAKKPSVRPLILLLPFVFAVTIQVVWLAQPEYNHSRIIHSAVFVPFLCVWGLQFSHLVGRMILAHITSTPLPRWDWLWVWNIIGALDANLPHLLDRPPMIQTSIRNTTVFVWIILLVTLFAYARFCILVIHDITNYLGIACFSVQKKDENGVWQHLKKT